VTLIRYEELTWPEVADLPRDMPVVLPLGTINDAEVARFVGEFENVCVLPALPYGWSGSMVNVGEAMLRRVVEGIISAPLEEGFRNIMVAHDGPEDLSMEGVSVISTDSLQAERLPLQASQQRVILISTGHTEQHGYHLPMNTDTVIIGAITQGVFDAIPHQAEMLPVLPYGVSMHRREFAGTFNMGGRTYEDFMLAVLDVLIGMGADRFYLMSGHGGNCSFLANIVKYTGDRHPGIFAATTWLHTSGRIASPAVETHRHSSRGGMGHAGELETAYLLYLQPALCHMDRVVDEIDFISTPGYFMDWLEGGDLVANPPWSDDTQTGSYGAGSAATAENGQRWLAAAIKEKIAHVHEIHDQQNRRVAKRQKSDSNLQPHK